MESPSPTPSMKRRVVQWFARNRRRLAFLSLIAGLLLIGQEVGSALPQAVEAHYQIGTGVQRLQVRYVQGSQLLRGAEFGPIGNARHVQDYLADDFALAPGRYTVEFDIEYSDGHQQYDRTLEIPVEGVVRFRLEESP